MKREYFCTLCGLFHWVKMYELNEVTKVLERISHKECLNPKCDSHGVNHPDLIVPVDTTSFFYYAQGNSEYIDSIKWTAPEYAPEEAIQIYRNQGVEIRV